MSGTDLRALRRSLNLTRAQAAIVTRFHWYEVEDLENKQTTYGGMAITYERRLIAWQQAGERKGTDE